MTDLEKNGIMCKSFRKCNFFLFRKVRNMFEKKIKLADSEEVCGFVKAAEKCDFDIDISYNHILIDAKSFLGVLGLGFSRELTVKYGDRDENFETVLNKYAVA